MTLYFLKYISNGSRLFLNSIIFNLNVLVIIICYNIKVLIPPDSTRIIYYCSLAEITACCLIIYTSPANTHSMYKESFKRIPNKIFLIISLTFVMLVVISEIVIIPYLYHVVITVMIASICYSFLVGFFDEKKKVTKSIPKAILLWSLCLLLFILSSIFNFFNYIKDINITIYEGFHYLPLFYIVLNIGLVNKLKMLEDSVPKDFITLLSKYKVTKREVEVAYQLFLGNRIKDISTKLNISSSTVKKHISNIYTKTDSKNIAEFLDIINS